MLTLNNLQGLADQKRHLTHSDNLKMTGDFLE